MKDNVDWEGSGRKLMDRVQTPSWFSAPCSKHVFSEMGVGGTVWPYRRRGVKWGARWVKPEGFTGLPAIHGWKRKNLLIRSVSPSCQLSKCRQESSTGVEKLCIFISPFHLVLSTNKHCGLRFLWIPLSPTAPPERCPAAGQGRGQRGEFGAGALGSCNGEVLGSPSAGDSCSRWSVSPRTHCPVPCRVETRRQGVLQP